MPLLRRRSETQAEAREALIMHIIKGVFEPGDWEKLDPGLQKTLYARWSEELAGHNLNYLKQLASPAKGTPVVLTNDKFELQYTIQTQKRANRSPNPKTTRKDPFLSGIEELNRHGQVVHGFMESGDPAITDMSNYDRHAVVVGASGMGKSVYMSHIFTQLAHMDGPMVLIDPHRSLIEDILPQLPKHRWKDVVYIEPSNKKSSWGFNLMQMARGFVDEASEDYAQVINSVLEEMVETIVDALAVIQKDTTGTAAGASIKSMMKNGFLAVTEREQSTLIDAFFLLTDKTIQEIVTPQINRYHVRTFFENSYKDMKGDFTDRVRNKLDIFLNSVMVNMFSRREECVGMTDLIEGNKILVFDLNRDDMPNSVSSLIGYMVLTVLMFIVDRRKVEKGSRPPFLTLCIDEFQNFASETTVRWLAEARKKNAGMIVGFQHLAQLSEEIVDALGNAATWTTFRTSVKDAKFLGEYMDIRDGSQVDMAQLTKLKQYHAHLFVDVPDPHSETVATVRERKIIQTMRPLPPIINSDEIIEKMKEHSRRKYYRVHDAKDHQTIYTDEEGGANEVLTVIWDAAAAVRRKNQYNLMPFTGKQEWSKELYEKALQSLEKGVPTMALNYAIMRNRGGSLRYKAMQGLISNLILQGLVKKRRNTTYNLDGFELTKKGAEVVRNMVVPNASSNEGSDKHKAGVYNLFNAIGAISTMDREAPAQSTTRLTPDLVGHIPPKDQCSNYWQRIWSQNHVYFEVEETTRHKTDTLVLKIANAHDNDADCVFVLSREAADERARDTAANMHNAIMRLIRNPEGLPTNGNINALTSMQGIPFRIWVVDAQFNLYEYDPATTTLPTVIQANGGQAPSRHETPLASDYGHGQVAEVHRPTRPHPQQTLHDAPAASPAPVVRPANGKSTKASEGHLDVFLEAMNQLSMTNSAGSLKRSQVKAKMQAAGARDITDKQIDAWAKSELGFTVRERDDDAFYFI